MTLPRSTYVPTAGFEVHLTEWGNPKNPPLIMWHGLARTGRDFDEAAAALSETYFVICPDTIGRGKSSWSKKPEVDYSYRSYGDTVIGILAHFGIDRLRWVGTSMGGLIGITLAAGRLKDRMTHLVINDIGPDISAAAVNRIADYVGNPPVYNTMAELEAWLRKNYAPFGENTPGFWRRMVDSSSRRTDNGQVTVHYDPAIVSQFTHHKADLDVWNSYDAVEAKTLLIRGATSDVLSPAVAAQMVERGPKPRLLEFENIGHAPTLASAEEIAKLRAFLAS